MLRHSTRQAADVRVRLCCRHTGTQATAAADDWEAEVDEATVEAADGWKDELAAVSDAAAVLRLDGGLSRPGSGTVRRDGSEEAKGASEAAAVAVAVVLRGAMLDGGCEDTSELEGAPLPLLTGGRNSAVMAGSLLWGLVRPLWFASHSHCVGSLPCAVRTVDSVTPSGRFNKREKRSGGSKSGVCERRRPLCNSTVVVS